MKHFLANCQSNCHYKSGPFILVCCQTCWCILLVPLLVCVLISFLLFYMCCSQGIIAKDFLSLFWVSSVWLHTFMFSRCLILGPVHFLFFLYLFFSINGEWNYYTSYTAFPVFHKQVGDEFVELFISWKDAILSSQIDRQMCYSSMISLLKL